jgi:hypothetical protein
MSVSDDVSLVIEETRIDLEEGKSRNRWVVWGILAFVLAFVLGFLSVRAASKKNADQENVPPAQENP